MRDRKRSNIVLLKDNHPLDDYFYELIVFTGNRSESGTRSKVKLFLVNLSVNIFVEAQLNALNDV
jgi:hypothetical protein